MKYLITLAIVIPCFADSRCPIDVGSTVWGPVGSRPMSNVSSIINYNGFQAGTATTSWRQNITSSPISAHSAAWLEDMRTGGGTVTPPPPAASISPNDYVSLFNDGWEGFVAHFIKGNLQRRMIVRDNVPPREGYAGESDPGTFPLPNDIIVEGFKGRNSRPWGTNLDIINPVVTDQQSFVIDTDNCIAYELWRVFKDGSNISAGTYAAFDMLAGDLQRPIGMTSNSVSGMQSWSTVLRREEFNAGVINHALEMTVYGSSTTAYAFPATHSQCCGGWHSSHIPFGAKARLKSTYVRDPSIPAGCDPIITALKTYGIVNKDGGRSGDMYGETNWIDFTPCRAIYPRNYLEINPTDWDIIETGTIYCPNGEYQSGTVGVTNGSPNVTWTTGDKFWDGIATHEFYLTVPGGGTYTMSSLGSCVSGDCTTATLTNPWAGSSGTVSALFYNETKSGTATVTNGSTTVTWATGDKYPQTWPAEVAAGTKSAALILGVMVAHPLSVSGCSGGFCTGLVLDQNYLGSTGTVDSAWTHIPGINCTSTIPTGTAPVISSFTASGHTLHWVVSGVVDGDDNPVRLRNISTGIRNPAVPCTHMDQTDDGNRCKLGPGWIDGPAHGESVIVDPEGVSRVYTLMVQNRWGRSYANVTVAP